MAWRIIGSITQSYKMSNSLKVNERHVSLQTTTAELIYEFTKKEQQQLPYLPSSPSDKYAQTQQKKKTATIMFVTTDVAFHKLKTKHERDKVMEFHICKKFHPYWQM